MPDASAPQLPLRSKMALLLHSPRAFETWLRQRPAEEPTVGATGDPRACPLATFLCARLDLSAGQEIIVYPTRATVRVVPKRVCDQDRVLPGAEMATYTLPAWARALVRAVDRGCLAGNGLSRSVTRDQALDLLAESQDTARAWAAVWASLMTPVDGTEGAGEASSKEMAPTAH